MLLLLHTCDVHEDPRRAAKNHNKVSKKIECREAADGVKLLHVAADVKTTTSAIKLNDSDKFLRLKTSKKTIHLFTTCCRNAPDDRRKIRSGGKTRQTGSKRKRRQSRKRPPLYFKTLNENPDDPNHKELSNLVM